MARHRSDTADPGLAQRVKAARQAAGLTQEQVAQSLKVSLYTYQSWESGHTEPKVSQFRNLCHLLERTPQALLGIWGG